MIKWFLLILLLIIVLRLLTMRSGRGATSLPGPATRPDEAELRRQVQVLLARGKKLQAVKLVRQHTGLLLGEAKAIVERIAAGGPVSSSPPQFQDGPPVGLDSRTLDEIRNLAHSGNKIAAIKLMRERTGMGLREAKDAVESL